MAEQLNLRPAISEDFDIAQELLSAIKCLRAIRAPIFISLLLSFLLPLSLYGLARTDDTWKAAWKQQVMPDPQSPSTASRQVAPWWYSMAEPATKLAAFVARLATLLMVLVYLLTTNVCLAGRIGGAGEAIVALFWAIFLFFFLIPWHAWLGGSQIPTPFFNAKELFDASVSQSADRLEEARYYIRFVVCPFLGLLTAGVADVRFGRCYALAMKRIRQQLGISGG